MEDAAQEGALYGSITFQTTTAAISIGLPDFSLTFSRDVSWLRTRNEILCFFMNGFAQKKPLRMTVPR